MVQGQICLVEVVLEELVLLLDLCSLYSVVPLAFSLIQLSYDDVPPFIGLVTKV